MTWKHAPSVVGFLGFVLLSAIVRPGVAAADEVDPPSRVARLAYAEGSVSFEPAGTEDWVVPPVNRPLTTGDKLWADRDSRVELQLDGSILRLSSRTAVSFLNLGDHITQIQLTGGTLIVRVRRLDDDETYEIDTPNLAFSILRPGLYRLSVDESGQTTTIAARYGQGEVTGGGSAYPVHADEYDVFSGTDELAENSQPYGNQDPFDAWSESRDNRWEHSVSARYVSPDAVGYEDLDEHGSWRTSPDYGYVWYPSGVDPRWAPYHEGHWAYIAPWGYTWVDDQPWGFAPFHYGRWVSVDGAWGWVPCQPQPEGAVYVRPVYAPALVAWVGVEVGIAWFALGPREVYVPSYPVSRNYVNNINISNTMVNKTIVNNVYNTTIINNKMVNVTYVNRGVPGAVTATTSQAFTSAQPVARNPVHLDQRSVAQAQLRVTAPAAVPTKHAVLGSGRIAAVKPPALIQARTVVARTAPPPPAPPFERRLDAIRQNGGKPLSVTEVRQMQASAPSRAAPVRIAPPATLGLAYAPVAPLTPHSPDRPPERPTGTNTAPTIKPSAAAIHPNEFPPPRAPASPSIADSALERQHLQDQQRLHNQQLAERQRIQQQQELEHQQLAKAQADAARNQQLELQHQQQSQALLQQHAHEQEQLQQKQQQQRQQQESQTKPAIRRDDRPPNPKP